MTQDNQNNPKPGFDYCMWAKMLIAFPTIFIVVVAVAGMFTNPIFQMLGGAAAGVAVVAVGMAIEKLPFLQKKIYTPKSE